jgi:hypothetical protein
MLITREFVFLHIPKTGGTFLRSVCAEHFPVVDEGIKHGGLRAIPERFRQLPRFTLVRNPWDWHVSFYAYMHESAPEPWLRDWCAGSFETFMRTPPMPIYRKRGIYMTNVIGTVGSLRSPAVDIGRTETLADDFLSFLRRHAIPEPPDLSAGLAGAPTNVSTRADYRIYYDDSLTELVANRCRPLIRRFGYEF